MEETKPSEPLLYPNAKAWAKTNWSEQYINEKILANNKFNNNFNIIIDIENYYETETENYTTKLSKYKTYTNIAEITEIALSPIGTTAPATSVAVTGIGVPYSIPTADSTATVCSSLSF